ncbi:exodeoxyribonuclease VII small subunit [Sedimentibacter sp. zth1]|uniref:exodeoxyribonuclease VII small subunit n=1 Tax=Sedimentibacter sp. zth1 TaxID=2816908 RepID=UPI001A912C31|nr:exodeoxyribonuclease VII small subunit [Sedimentibacter sp. zth1]QSX06814.1 exodeoxyribonuclease VII small subunit [Sedimentibacter sp. zth1]
MVDKSENYESFEQAMDVLKSTVQNLEKGSSVKLDNLIQNYEKGINAYNYCINKLEQTKKQINIINNNEII